ncbi:MAG: VPLPA-CTERM sorting domain-containing protein, partial [Thiogranum sp.]
GLVSGFTIGPHDVRLLFGGGNPGVAYNFDDPIFGNFDHSAYHDWVMDVKVGTGAYTVTVDNSIVLNGIGETTLLPNQVRFGDGSSNGRAESELTSLSLTSSNSKIIDLKFDSLPTAQGWSLDTTAGVEEANVFSVANGVLTMNTLGEDYDVGAMYFSAVPIPAAAWLFGSGLLGLVGIARRKKA